MARKVFCPGNKLMVYFFVSSPFFYLLQKSPRVKRNGVVCSEAEYSGMERKEVSE
jgi:hypothetical protein